MRLYNNLPAVSTQKSLSKVSGALDKSVGKLASGLRINHASDDAAGLSISEKMRAQMRGLDQATRNAQDGVSMIQTAEGALGEAQDILVRMKELAVQASNDTLTSQDRSYIQEEINQLKDELNRISKATQFNKKQLLDGSATVLWSADTQKTQVLVRGAVNEIAEGNYKITIQTEPGSAQVQKTNVMRVSGKDAFYPLAATGDTGVTAVSNMPPANYDIAAEAATLPMSSVQQAFGLNVTDFNVASPTLLNATNSNILLEVTHVDSVSGAVHFNAVSTNTDPSGITTRYWDEDLIIATTGIQTSGGTYDALGVTLNSGDFSIPAASLANYNAGDKLVIRLGWAPSAPADSNITVDSTINQEWPDGWTGPRLVPIGSQSYNLDKTALTGKTIDLHQFYLNPRTGDVMEGSFTLSFDNAFVPPASAQSITGLTTTYIGQKADAGVQLKDINNFWDANGNFLLDPPKTVNINQADGRSAAIILYGSNTLADLAAKINSAIADGLGQRQYASGNSNGFASFVQREAGELESTRSTIVIRSAIPGKEGEISLTGHEDIINALGLNTIKRASENVSLVSVVEAHSGKNIAAGLKMTGNTLAGIPVNGVDTWFHSTSGLSAVWNDTEKRYDITSSNTPWTTTVHIADNMTKIQIGAEGAATLSLGFGDIRSAALGLDKVVLSDRESSSKAISIIDAAFHNLSKQRAALGAWQNRLEYAARNMTTGEINTTSSESRIRDLDMAQEMVNFTKLNILNQSGQGMLMQANQLPQTILTLLQK